MEYKRKDYAKDALIINFDKDIDYVSEFSGKDRKTPAGGRPKEFIFLTVDCFKSFCMMAGTEKSWKIHVVKNLANNLKINQSNA